MYKKLLRKSISLLLSFSLLFQNIAPVIVLAQELDQADPTPTEQTTPTPTPTTEVTPDPTPTEQITPSPDPTPTPTVELTPTPTEAPSPDPTPTPTEEINPTPTEQITPTPELTPGITPTPVITPTQSWTHTNLALNQTYTAPQNDKVKITFNKLPQSSGNILIREIKLTQQQVELTNAVSDTAYDITSDMQDGTFSYNLELPLPESISTKEVEMVYAGEIAAAVGLRKKCLGKQHRPLYHFH